MNDLPVYVCRRTPEPIRIDGRLNEAVWDRITPIGNFRFVDGVGEPELPTELRLCWDDQNLYLGWIAIDTDIWGTYRNHDDPVWEEEVVEAFLCSGGDAVYPAGRSLDPSSPDPIPYFEFNFSPHNVVFDAKICIPENGDRKLMQSDVAWVCQGLQSAVKVYGTIDRRNDIDEKWIVTASIPFAEIGREGRAPVGGEAWRANFYRIDRAGKGEFSCWSPTLAGNFHVPARFGRLVFSEEGW